jgi:TetR/AcrR family tetracycline transcriptional repressor
MRLKRETIVQGGLELLDEVGLNDFTTRRLADRLGIQSPTLYWHFESKGALLQAMALAMLKEHDARPSPAPGADWRNWFRESGHSFRRALLSRRDGARVHAGTLPSLDQLPRTEAMMRLLRSAGFGPEEAFSILIGLSRFVLGWVMEEQAAAENGSADWQRLLKLPSGQFPFLDEAATLTKDQSPDLSFDRAISFFLGILRPKYALRLEKSGQF